MRTDDSRLSASVHQIKQIVHREAHSDVSSECAGALAEKHRDHALTGDWKDHRDCHIRPDLVLIYRKPDPDTLQIVRLGSHSQLGL